MRAPRGAGRLGSTHIPDRYSLTFSDLDIDQDMVDALAAKGIIEPFPIQTQTIPLALAGQDIIGQAKTGTGKTFGFGLPLIQALGLDPEPGVQALVVVPTRELCVQVAEDLELAASNRATKIVAIYGGKAYEGQVEQLKAGAQIVVGTPGRLLDLAGQRLLSLKDVKVMVLDEADKMLDLGFLPDVEKLFAQTPPDPAHDAVLGDDARPGRRARAPLHEPADPHPRDRPRRGPHAGEHQARRSTARTRSTRTRSSPASCRPRAAARPSSSRAPSAPPRSSSRSSTTAASTPPPCTATSTRSSASARWPRSRRARRTS